MNAKELGKNYDKIAKDRHPDVNFINDDFIELMEEDRYPADHMVFICQKS